MYTILYNLYFSIKRKLMKQPGNKLYIKIIGYIEAYYNLHVVKSYTRHASAESGLTDRKRGQKVIVSFTSFPKRISTVWITVETLMRQTVKADEIILWLAESQFPSIEDVPMTLRRLQSRGLTIRFCKDLRSHKKYFYVMQEHPEDLIILVDDDTFYPEDMIEQLLKLHRENPEDIVCMTPQIISPEFESLPSLWRNPGPDEKVQHSYYAQPYSGQGTLYPPHVIPDEAFQEEKIMQLCPFADDLWLKFMSLKTGTRTTAAFPFRSIPVTIYGTGVSSLWYINGQDGKNDEQWNNLMEAYPDDFSRFKLLR
jgi:hypothetical protein